MRGTSDGHFSLTLTMDNELTTYSGQGVNKTCVQCVKRHTYKEQDFIRNVVVITLVKSICVAGSYVVNYGFVWLVCQVRLLHGKCYWVGAYHL